MESLTLPGGGEDGPGRDLDPRTLAAISITAKDFTLGNRHLGAVEADFLRVPNGLHASGLKVADASFTIEGVAPRRGYAERGGARCRTHIWTDECCRTAPAFVARFP